jgi:hypothetical protein
MKEIYTEIEIEAPAERVWQLLTDFNNFSNWNPFIRRIQGVAKPGQQLEVYIQPSGTKGMTFRPTVLKADPNCQLRWLGHFFIPGLFDGDHCFAIERLNENRVRFIQRESFTGLLVPFLAQQLDRDTKRGFEAMNRALKEQAEQNQSLKPM